ncbi:hypothetical protein OC846_002674 [Tilletia horrida]|uniref:MIT domain-containing protein n=1 Tax=Tilletia horrida TaxID=155126 RepID=A0AAN6GRH6_9BASI|nr:hypothetical protein OC845_002396 [Tilletia horrida]KAK0553058.1 hypothetical protein OC846_002674 [Tilletia horrida]KAK0569704.1 hypothetical protein OC861_000666 [Tilletia horrida]
MAAQALPQPNSFFDPNAMTDFASSLARNRQMYEQDSTEQGISASSEQSHDHDREFQTGSPSSSRIIHDGHSGYGFASQQSAMTSTDPFVSSSGRPPSLSAHSTQRKANSRGMRLGSQLRKPASSQSQGSEVAVATSDRRAKRSMTDSSTSTGASAAESGSDRVLEEHVEENAVDSELVAGTSSAFVAEPAAEAPMTSAPASSSRSVSGTDGFGSGNIINTPSKLPALQPATTNSGSTSSATSPNPNGAGPTPPRPPRKLGGRVAALAAKLSGNELTSTTNAAAIPTPSPTRSNMYSATSSPQPKSQQYAAPNAKGSAGSPVPLQKSNVSTTSASPSFTSDSSPSAGSPAASQIPGNFSPRSSSLKKHKQQSSSTGSVRKLAEAIANAASAAETSSAGRKRSSSRRGSADLLTGSDATAESGPSSELVTIRATGRISEDRSSKGRPSLDVESRSSGRRDSASGSASDRHMSSALHKSASPPPSRSPRRMHADALARAEQGSPSSPSRMTRPRPSGESMRGMDNIGDLSMIDSSLVVEANSASGSTSPNAVPNGSRSGRLGDLTMDTSVGSASESQGIITGPHRSASGDSQTAGGVKDGDVALGSPVPPSAWTGSISSAHSLMGTASPILGSSTTPTATSASGHSTASLPQNGAQGPQPHNKALGRLSRLTYARNDGVSVFGTGGPHGGGKGWAEYNSAPNSAGPRSPSFVGSQNGFAAAFGIGSAPGAPGSVAGSSRGGSVSMSSGVNSLRTSVDANGLGQVPDPSRNANGTSLGLAIANMGNATPNASVAGAHGLTLALSPNSNAGNTNLVGNGSHFQIIPGSPGAQMPLHSALSPMRNSLPVGGLRSDTSPGRDGADRMHLSSVQEGPFRDESGVTEQQFGDGRDSDALMGLGIDHTQARMAARTMGPRASLPTLSGVPPQQRELLLPALQSVRSAYESDRRDTFHFGHGSQRPVSALLDESALAALSNSKEDQHPASAVSSLGSSATRSSRNGEFSYRPGRNSTSPPTTGESASNPSGRLSLQEPSAGERLRLTRKPSHPTLLEESEQPVLPESPNFEVQARNAVRSDARRPSDPQHVYGQQRGSEGTGTVGGVASARNLPGPEDQIEGLTIQLKPEGGFTYLDANGQPIGSKTVLTLAIDKAKTAVTLDSSNKVPEAITAYKHALRLLEEVMDRISPKPGQKPKPNREEERRRLVIIHDTYADRIRLLSAIKGNGGQRSPSNSKTASDQQPQASQSEAQSSFNADMIPQRPRANQQPQRSDGFHEAVAAAAAGQQTPKDQPDSMHDGDFRASLRNVASADLLRSQQNRRTSNATERPISMGVSPAGASGAMEQRFSTRPYQGDDPTKRDSMATALSSHTLTPRNVLGSQAPTQTSEKKKQHTPMIAIQPESPETRQVELNTAEVTSEILPGLPRSSGQLPAQSEATSESGSVLDARRRSSSSASRPRAATDELRTPTTPYFDTSSSLHFDDDISMLASSSRPASNWSGQQAENDKEKPSTLGVGLMSPPSVSGGSDSVRLRPLSASTEGGASQAASDGHPSEAEAELDRALAGLDASLSQLSHERKQGTVKARRQSRASMHSSVAAAEKAAAAAAAATVLDGGSLTRTGGSKQRASVLRSEGGDAREGSRSGAEFPRMAAEDGDVEPELRSASSRQRASSQPAPKRPPIPFSFMNGSPQPPMPRLARKNSESSTSILSPTSAVGRAPGANSIRPGPGGQSGFRFPSPSPSATSTFAPSEGMYPSSAAPFQEGPLLSRSTLAMDLFPTGLPSTQFCGTPSYATSISNTALPQIDLDVEAHDISQLNPMPASVILRPFFVLRQLQLSLERGSHLSRKLYAPKNLWAASHSAGAKIALIDLKVRMLDLVATGLEPVESGGRALLQPPVVAQPGLLAVQATRFARQLDEFELLLMDVQNSLAQKISVVDSAAGKKNKNALGTFGSRLKGSFGGLTSSSKNLDTPADYFTSIARLCAKLGHLDQHAKSILRANSGATENDARSPGTETYAALPTEVRVSIEAKLKRTSDWIANVLLCFVLRDIAIVMDKYTKRASLPLVEG